MRRNPTNKCVNCNKELFDIRCKRCKKCFKENNTPRLRFFRQINKNSTCWLWTGAKTGNGYGGITISNKIVAVHRYSWEYHFGKIPKGMLVCHKCDKPLCVNPDHLFLGTFSDNSNDASKKGRLKHKLTKEEVKEIKNMYIPRKVGLSTISKKYDVSEQTINRIVKKQTWKHV